MKISMWTDRKGPFQKFNSEQFDKSCLFLLDEHDATKVWNDWYYVKGSNWDLPLSMIKNTLILFAIVNILKKFIFS